MNAKTTQRCAERHAAEVSESVNSTKTSQAVISKVSAECCVSLFLPLVPSEQFVPSVCPLKHLVSAGREVALLNQGCQKLLLECVLVSLTKAVLQ